MSKFKASLLITACLILISACFVWYQTGYAETSSYKKGIKPNHLSQAVLDKQLTDFYKAWKDYYLVEVKESKPIQKYVYYNREHLAEPYDAIACSEGQGYGMLVSAMMAEFDPNAKADFDAQYRYAKAHPSAYTPEFMAWQQVMDGTSILDTPEGGQSSATDGDMDIAYALLVADKKWGSTGSINYKKEAVVIIKALMKDVVHPTEYVLKLGNWVDDEDPVYGKSTRLSDFMLEHIKVFKKYDKENAVKWNKVYWKMIAIINYQYRSGGSIATGLMPDFMVKGNNGKYLPAEPDFLESEHDGDYSYNACRVPMRFAMDYMITGSTNVKAQLDALNKWIKIETKGKPENIRSGYYISGGKNGTSYAEYGDLCFVAPFMVSAMINASNQSWLNSLWDYTVSYTIDQGSYYDNSLKLLSMIVTSGHWISP